VEIVVNGRWYQVAAAPETPLLWVLRQELGLTGTKYACGQGACGACTVLVDDRPRRACVTPVQAVNGRRIITIEGIPAHHPVKLAWLRARVPQCGYCQPGMIMQTIGLLAHSPQATAEELTAGLHRNLCRCGTYPRIKAALAALAAGAGGDAPAPAAPAYFSEAPRLGRGLGLVVMAAKPGYRLEVVSHRRSALDPPVWFWLTPDNVATVVVSKAEMGQGVMTALPLLVAAALDHPWELLRVETAPAGAGYVDPKMGRQLTGGSTSIVNLQEICQMLGATARELLLAAAAQTWGVPRAACRAQGGEVHHDPSGRRLTYGALCEQAARLPVPALPLRQPDGPPSDQNIPRPDLILKVNGTAVFGMDVQPSAKLFGVVARPPRFDAVIQAWDPGRAAASPGVHQIFRWDENVGIVAQSLSQAWQARELLDITWSPGSQPELSDRWLADLFSQQLERPGVVVLERGDPAPVAPGSLTHTADYFLPYLAHAAMEPMNCRADVRPDFCEIWAPLQNQSAALAAVQELTGLAPEQILIHTTFLGGGFGRRLEVDYVMEAVRLSQAAGEPVQLVWTRAEDFRYDFFRPMTASRCRGGLDAAGRLLFWDHAVAAPAVMARVYPRALQQGFDPDAVAGLQEMPYTTGHYRLRYIRTDTPIPVGFWRSVGHSHNAFVMECFMDEMAHLAGQDPLAFRLAHLPADSRAARVLQLAAAKADWDKPLPPGQGRGLAQHWSFGSYVAQVAEVTVAAETGAIRVQRIVCAVDCGNIVHPDTVVAQMEGGILFGLSAALHEQVHFAQGGVASRDFHDYPILTISETPQVEVYLLPSGQTWGGVGEPGVPPVAPAVANAIFAATGRRQRRLPLMPK